MVGCIVNTQFNVRCLKGEYSTRLDISFIDKLDKHITGHDIFISWHYTSVRFKGLEGEGNGGNF